jgi:subtilisin-like proprotein convertase family protein
VRRRLASPGSNSPRRAGLIALGVVLAAGLVSSPTALADLYVQHDHYVATELPGASDGDGIIGPGDTFTLTENVMSAEPRLLTHVTGTLSTTVPGVTVGQPSSAYPDLQFGVATGNTTPFQATLATTTECGISVPFTLAVNTDQGMQAVSFTVLTGAAGTPVSYAGTGVPAVIPSPGTAVSTFSVATAGRVHGVTVSLSSLTQSYDGDLRIDLIAPDGTDVELFAPKLSNSGQNFTNTVFTDSAATSILSATAPYTGSFRPAQLGGLSVLDGSQQQGTWRLRIVNNSFGDSGSLNSWGASVTPASCTAPAPAHGHRGHHHPHPQPEAD